MNLSPTVFAQILAGLDANELARAAARFPMPRASRALSAYDHFAAMVFGQLTYRESLRGIEACLRTRAALAYRMGIRGRVTRTNLAYANEHRPRRQLDRPTPGRNNCRCRRRLSCRGLFATPVRVSHCEISPPNGGSGVG